MYRVDALQLIIILNSYIVYLHINRLKKESKLAIHVQILKRRNWVMAMINLSCGEIKGETLEIGSNRAFSPLPQLESNTGDILRER